MVQKISVNPTYDPSTLDTGSGVGQGTDSFRVESSEFAKSGLFLFHLQFSGSPMDYVGHALDLSVMRSGEVNWFTGLESAWTHHLDENAINDSIYNHSGSFYTEVELSLPARKYWVHTGTGISNGLVTLTSEVILTF